jgi:hypothetical protein
MKLNEIKAKVRMIVNYRVCDAQFLLYIGFDSSDWEHYIEIRIQCNSMPMDGTKNFNATPMARFIEWLRH